MKKILFFVMLCACPTILWANDASESLSVRVLSAEEIGSFDDTTDQFLWEAQNCYAKTRDSNACKADLQDNMITFLQHMQEACADEADDVQACTDTVNAKIIQVEEETDPVTRSFSHWQRNPTSVLQDIGSTS